MSSVDSELRSKFSLEWTGEALHIAVEIKGKNPYGREQTAECQTTAQASVKTLPRQSCLPYVVSHEY